MFGPVKNNSMSEKLGFMGELDLFLSLRNFQVPLRKKSIHMKEQFQNWGPRYDVLQGNTR